MATAVKNPAAKAPKKRKKEGMIKQVFKRTCQNKLALGGMIVMILLIVLAIVSPWIAPYGITEQDYDAIAMGPSLKHLFGTDYLGRDIFSRCLIGARYSLSFGLICALVTGILGNGIGVIVGYIGGTVDMIAMRIVDIITAIPGQLLSIIISAALGNGFGTTIIAMSIGGIPMSARNSRAMCLRERQMEYLEAAYSINVPTGKIMFKHMLPNMVAPALVGTTMSIGNSIMGAAGLSFIGLGIQPPTPEWGAMLSNARAYVTTAPYMMIFPGIMIAIVVLSINLFGDGLRDAMDPRLKK